MRQHSNPPCEREARLSNRSGAPLRRAGGVRVGAESLTAVAFHRVVRWEGPRHAVSGQRPEPLGGRSMTGDLFRGRTRFTVIRPAVAWIAPSSHKGSGVVRCDPNGGAGDDEVDARAEGGPGRRGVESELGECRFDAEGARGLGLLFVEGVPQ